MGVTLFSFILLPLSAIWFNAPAKLLKMLLIFAPFEAASALSLGGLGVQPGLVPAFAFIGFMCLQMLLGARFGGQSRLARVVRPFLVVTAWALISSFVMPRVFRDTVFVWPQKSLPPFLLTALAPNEGNIHQDIYLIADSALMVFAAMWMKSRRMFAPFIRFYFLSGFLVAAVSFWQFASRVAGVPYPRDIFYSNPGLAILADQTMGPLPRINGPFTEPAALATYMVSIVFATGWIILQGHRGAMIRWLFFIGLLTIAISTSTTGFAALAVAVVVLPVYALVTGSMRMFGAIVKLAGPLIVVIGLLFAFGAVFIPDLGKTVQVVYGSTVNKQESSSYDERTGIDLDSLSAAVDTYGLGTGWGSNRSSSLLPGLLATIGLPGVVGLAWFCAGLAGQVRRVRRRRLSREQFLVIDGSCGALVGFLVAAVLSDPAINSVTFFVLVSLLAACSSDAAEQQARRLERITPGEGVMSPICKHASASFDIRASAAGDAGGVTAPVV